MFNQLNFVIGLIEEAANSKHQGHCRVPSLEKTLYPTISAFFLIIIILVVVYYLVQFGRLFGSLGMFKMFPSKLMIKTFQFMSSFWHNSIRMLHFQMSGDLIHSSAF